MGKPSTVGKPDNHHVEVHTTAKPSGKPAKKPADVAAAPKPETVFVNEAPAVADNSVSAHKGIKVLGHSPVESDIPANPADPVNTKPVEAPGTPPAAAPTPPATPAPAPKLGITSSSGEYDDGVYQGKITGVMQIPNLEKAIRMLTGEDTSSFKQLPLMIKNMVNYSGGVLTYGLDSDATFVRNLGYRLRTSITRKGDEITISWTNADPQPKRTPDDSKLVNFKKNDGYWTLAPIKDHPGYYNVTWKTHTVVDTDTLQPGSGIVFDSTITKDSNKGARGNFNGALHILKDLK